tara:strand:- start:5476 stop:5736 length:261 start_codon:yes stop_codon:yes gene_type:complete
MILDITKSLINIILQVFSNALYFVVKIYQRFISPFFPKSCRFQPSCSQYALDCLKKHSFFKSLYLISKRILKCHPFGSSGYDPVPD